MKSYVCRNPPTQTTAGGGRRRRKRSTRNKRKTNKKRRSVKGKSKKNTQSKKHRYYTGGKGNGNKGNSGSRHTKRHLSVAKTQQIKSQYKTNPHTGTYSEADRRSLIKKGVRLTKKRSL